jgi:hypothetical protein
VQLLFQFYAIDHLKNTTFWIVATIENGVFCKWSIQFVLFSQNYILIILSFVVEANVLTNSNNAKLRKNNGAQ